MKMADVLLSSSPSSLNLDDGIEDECSICLEPLTSLNPASVTKCKHEYHLHCILEWSLRSGQCPVCLQHLVLNDPSSQEMILEAQRMNKSKTKRSCRENHVPRSRDSDRQRLMRRRVAAAAAFSSARMIMIARRRRPSANPADLSIRSRLRSMELVSFSDSLKSKLSTASLRYRESLTKRTRSLKEKILARNGSVKELSKGVQREMSAGIARIARLISRKRNGDSSTGSREASHARREASSIEDESIVEPLLPVTSL